jgi:hypothetical protein
MRTKGRPTVNWDDYAETEQPIDLSAGFVPKQQTVPADATLTEIQRGEIPLTSHWAATEQGLNRVAEGAQHAVTGAYNIIRHPIDSAKGLLKAPGEFIDQLGQVPGAIRDINASADPTGCW